MGPDGRGRTCKQGRLYTVAGVSVAPTVFVGAEFCQIDPLQKRFERFLNASNRYATASETPFTFLVLDAQTSSPHKNALQSESPRPLPPPRTDGSNWGGMDSMSRGEGGASPHHAQAWACCGPCDGAWPTSGGTHSASPKDVVIDCISTQTHIRRTLLRPPFSILHNTALVRSTQGP